MGEIVMTECEEVADTMKAPRGASYDECLAIALKRLPGETVVVIDNVAYAMYMEARFDLKLLTGLKVWASYLVNGDASGLDADERKQADAWLERQGIKSVLDTVNEPYFTYNPTLYVPDQPKAGGMVQDYRCELRKTA
jgi:hypothetical protein